MAPKRKATPTKKSAKVSGQRYAYTSLNNVPLSSGPNVEHHIYGAIIDATFPYKVSKDKFICSLKIVDNTHSGKDYASVVIYAKRFEDLPIVHRVGDIIRLHRATLRIYDDHRQFNVNTQLWGAWALFSTDSHSATGNATRANEPMSHNGKAATFEKHEVDVLSKLRKWTSTYFGNSDGVTKDMYIKCAISKHNQASDFDVVAKITQLHNFDEYTNELRLCDAAGECWFTLATKLKFPHLKAGDCVRIRSVCKDETSTNKKVLTQSHYSNIMTFINGSKLAKNYAGAKHSAKEEASLKGCNHANVVTAPAARMSGHHFSTLAELYEGNNKDGSTHRVCVQVLAVQPGDVREMTKSNAGGKLSSAKGSKDKGLVWHVQMLCKDAASANGDKQYKLLNYSDNGMGSNFFGAAKDLHTNAAARKDVETKVAQITQFNTWVDCIVEKCGSNFIIRDTAFSK